MSKVRFSSKRLLLTLMLCACSVILLQNYDISQNSSFVFNLLCMLCGLAICFALFVPSIIIKKRTNLDFLTVAHTVTPKLKIPIAVIYSLYFVWAAEFFLLPYTDMFSKKYYSDVTPCLIALILLSACVYAALKGVNVITRFGIFLFVFALLTNILMFGGSTGTLDFELYGFEISGNLNDFIQNTVYFIIPAFIVTLFACLSGKTKNFRLRQPLFALLVTGVKYGLIMFFIWFSLGDYASKQEYQTFILARAARIGFFGGIESLYLALATMSVFMIISLVLCAVTKSAGKESDIKYVVIFAVIIFAAHMCGSYLNSVKEIFTNNYIFAVFTVITAAVIPSMYIFAGRKSNARKALHSINMS